MKMSADPGIVKALALDLDGTILAPGSVLSERVKTAVNKCMRRGLKIIINTGRSIEGAEPYRSSLGAEGPTIYCNGAVVADMPSGVILSSILLDKKTAELCVDLSRETGIYFQIYFPGPASSGCTSVRGMSLVGDSDLPGRSAYYRQTGLLPEIRDLKEALRSCGQEGCVKAMFIAEPEEMALIRPKLEDKFGKSVYITQTQWNYLELMNVKASKGLGLKFVMERLSLKREEVIAFGDDENDLPMSEAAGLFVAPSNGKDTVKDKAGLVVGSSADDGVAVFLEEFFDL